MDKSDPNNQLVASGSRRRSSGGRRTLQDIATDFIQRDGNKGICRIDDTSGCKYQQKTCDVGNFIRHFRTQHVNAARMHGLVRESDVVAKRPRIIPKRLIAIDKRLLLESLAKWPSYHNLPLASVEWEGISDLLVPIGEAVGATINRDNFKYIIHAIARRVRVALADELRNRLISLKVDSASRLNRHVLGINVQYELDDRIVIRTLGMIEIKERQTAAFLKLKILDVLESYGVTIDQVFSVTVDNGANMLAAVRGLKQEFDLVVSQQLTITNILRKETPSTNADDDSDDEPDSDAEAETTASDVESQEMSDALAIEFQDQLNLVRCAVHTLQLASLDVVDKTDPCVKEITAIAKKCKGIRYKIFFDSQKAKYPPVWSPTRWGGIYKMVNTFRKQKDFFIQLGLQFPELVITPKLWDFIDQYVQAFEPVYIYTKKLQKNHVSLNDFYMEWLLTIRKVSTMFSNPYAQRLAESLKTRLDKLKTSQAFQMALYLDPRLNFLESSLFPTDEEKQYVQTCIKDTWNRISRLKPSSKSYEPAHIDLNNGHSQNDDFITELYGGTLSKADQAKEASFAQQLKGLDAEPRQEHTYDVFKHWLRRRETHPELFAVAMVVLATPSNQVSVERAFSALALVLSPHRAGLGAETLEDILLVKLNRDVFRDLCDSIDWDGIV